MLLPLLTGAAETCAKMSMAKSLVRRCESRKVMTSSRDWREGRMISASKIDLILRSRISDCHFVMACIFHQCTTTTTRVDATQGVHWHLTECL